MELNTPRSKLRGIFPERNSSYLDSLANPQQAAGNALAVAGSTDFSLPEYRLAFQ
jgi:hypothetical protein